MPPKRTVKKNTTNSKTTKTKETPLKKNSIDKKPVTKVTTKKEIKSNFRLKTIEILTSFVDENNANYIDEQVYKIYPDEQDYLLKMYHMIDSCQKSILLKDKINIQEFIDGIIQDLKNDKEGWEASQFDYIRQRESEELDYITQEVRLERGEHKCRKCGNDRCFTYQIQTRSLDEPATNYLVCPKCKTRGVLRE